MKTMANVLVGAALLFGPAALSEAIVKCPQPNGSVISVPDSVGCSTPLELRNQEAEQAAASQRRQSADFIQASEACTRKVGRSDGFKSVARPDGTVRMVGTASDRFDYQLCMEKAGHRLDAR